MVTKTKKEVIRSPFAEEMEKKTKEQIVVEFEAFRELVKTTTNDDPDACDKKKRDFLRDLRLFDDEISGVYQFTLSFEIDEQNLDSDYDNDPQKLMQAIEEEIEYLLTTFDGQELYIDYVGKKIS